MHWEVRWPVCIYTVYTALLLGRFYARFSRLISKQTLF